ncbi:DUF1189 family protein [Metalysinibacillus jejuensis]|uniref:DUF1189 family protein n=1 Tax=Metalysinibacillus jejuensis TaxID=914327 RepID=UPI000D3CA496|nr:DUF1189 family protein [Metalysinibacillus jejuensis]
MTHTQLFIMSLTSPKKLGAVRFMPIGKVLQYAFLLITLLTVFSFARFTTGVADSTLDMSGLMEYVEDIRFLLYPVAFILLFIVNTLLMFARISLYALAGTLFMHTMKRRGEYRNVWRTATFAITWATLLTMVFEFVPLPTLVSTSIAIFITMLFIIIGLTKYPQLPPATK